MFLNQFEFIPTKSLKDLFTVKAHRKGGGENGETRYLMFNLRRESQADEEKKIIVNMDNIGLKQNVGQAFTSTKLTLERENRCC